MAEITAQSVKDLREKTGAGMMDCKKALAQADGDMDQAMQELRKAGIAKAQKKAERSANEGRIAACVSGNGQAGALVETLCESDFVAKNEKFISFSDSVADYVVTSMDQDGDVSEAVQQAYETTLTDMVATIGENIKLRRGVRWNTTGRLAWYLHMNGKIGVLIDAEGSEDEQLLKDVCMHIAAFRPQYIGPEQVPQHVVDQEREIAGAQAEGKPSHVIDKIVEGKLQKWYTEVCLTKQPWLRDEKSTLEKQAPGLSIHRFLRWEVAEEL